MIEKLVKLLALDEFIEDHIVMDDLDGVERTMVEFNFNDWIRFKRENFDREEIAPINSKKGIEQRDQAREKASGTGRRDQDTNLI